MFVFLLPFQSFFFELRSHPLVSSYWQCTTIGSFSSHVLVNFLLSIKRITLFDNFQCQEMSYFLFVLLMTLVLPVILMLGSYLTIILLIYRRSKTHQTLATQRLETEVTLKTKSVIARAKIRTIKVTGVLVLGFILCWSPYYSMTLWWWFDRTSAQKTDYRLQKLLWAFACANNCLNPLLYRYCEKLE